MMGLRGDGGGARLPAPLIDSPSRRRRRSAVHLAADGAAWPEGESRAMQQEGSGVALEGLRNGAGTLFLLDGASCSGRAPLSTAEAGPGSIDLVPRY
jgi:hypothetical protein